MKETLSSMRVIVVMEFQSSWYLTAGQVSHVQIITKILPVTSYLSSLSSSVSAGYTNITLAGDISNQEFNGAHLTTSHQNK